MKSVIEKNHIICGSCIKRRIENILPEKFSMPAGKEIISITEQLEKKIRQPEEEILLYKKQRK
jgi:hypothetical protein